MKTYLSSVEQSRSALGIRRFAAAWTAGMILPGLMFLALAPFPGRAQTTNFMIQRPTPGGIDPHPYIRSIQDAPNDVLIDWFGFEGPYQIQRKSAIDGSVWSDVGGPNSQHTATIPKQGEAGFLRVNGASPPYAGNTICADCHGAVHTGWSRTAHASAFQTLKDIGQQNNASCVVCHTVGFGVPTGFIDEATTPDFADVQCENCHGPAGNHVVWAQGSQSPPKVLPVLTRSAMLCGGCHNDFHHPTYDEWTSSPHSVVIDALAGTFSSTNRATATARMNTCGACHSGAVRLEMIKAYTKNVGNAKTNVAWPSGFDSTNIPIACVVCHDTHDVHRYTNVVTGILYTNQLRYPLTSTNFFSYDTAASFASQYNTAVNVCGQCHNARGATVSSTSRAPHHSPQYNILLGNIGITTSATPPQGAHRNNSRQCAGCHTHRHDEDNPSEENPVFTGHTFRPTIQACVVCHTNATGPMSPTNLLFTVQAEISGLIDTTKNLLDLWATTKNTNAWASKYEALGWEYTTPGQLSNPSGSSSVVGPTSAEQAQIPQGIKDARFNMYLIEHDASKGIHNAPYARYLLGVAQDKVNAELNQP